jgi:hypothetical protein
MVKPSLMVFNIKTLIYYLVIFKVYQNKIATVTE